MNLTTENTAIVLDSTADVPEAPERFPVVGSRSIMTTARQTRIARVTPRFGKSRARARAPRPAVAELKNA